MAEAYFEAVTAAAAFIPELWSKEAIVARESNLILANLVRRYDAELASFGDTLHVPSVTNLTAGNISTSTGLLDAVNATETNVDIVIDKWKGVVVNVLDIVKVQSKQDLLSHYTKKMAYALGQIVEQDLAILAASLSQTVGTFNTDWTDANLRRAVQYLDDARAPFEDRHGVFKPAGRNIFLSMDKFVRSDAVGWTKEGSPILKGNIGQAYGFMVHITPETYKTVNNTSNMLFHRDCLGLALQQMPKTVQFGKQGFSDRVGMSEIYGVKEMRDDHGVEIRS